LVRSTGMFGEGSSKFGLRLKKLVDLSRSWRPTPNLDFQIVSVLN